MAKKHGLILLPEIHSEHGTHIHNELSEKGFLIYDFFFPGLVIDALDRGTNKHLLRWIQEILGKNIECVNMLGCHDGIPVIDLKGCGESEETCLLQDDEIEAVIDRILERGGRVKNLFGPDGKKISYYQVNATFFSALGENEQKLLLARAIQIFMPGIPQVWYLDLFAGKNNYEAAEQGGTGGHKEINRTGLSLEEVKDDLSKHVVQGQLALLRLRNTLPAFHGELNIHDSEDDKLQLSWKHGPSEASLIADLKTSEFAIKYTDENGKQDSLEFLKA